MAACGNNSLKGQLEAVSQQCGWAAAGRSRQTAPGRSSLQRAAAGMCKGQVAAGRRQETISSRLQASRQQIAPWHAQGRTGSGRRQQTGSSRQQQQAAGSNILQVAAGISSNCKEQAAAGSMQQEATMQKGYNKWQCAGRSRQASAGNSRQRAATGSSRQQHALCLCTP